MSDSSAAPEPSMEEILASIRRILAEDEAPVTLPPARSRIAGGGGDILDLTEALDDDGSVRHIPPFAATRTAPAAPVLPDGRVEPAPPRPEPPPAAGLVSDAASEAVAASFARLAAAQERNGGDARLDGLVRETLRPLLQAWLDEHLPPLVERLVRAEIGRVVGNPPPT
ncbi:MAG: DUF2497 domain-containing protein [Alphaproteobacteria bacterium]|nr:DUF2497 domain-containing protein [Alphaproteobacteria bacterium]MBV9554323.1 DUF2497 domain-containing protein [Alphaproteobacteria bacterium]